MDRPSEPTIAVLGPRGWLASAVIAALADAPCRVKAVYRQGSTRAELPDGVESVKVDWKDQEALLAALRGVDVVLSLVGQAGLADQLTLVPLLGRAGIKLFIPSDFAYVHTKEDDMIPVIHNKEVLLDALKKEGVPTCTILVGNFAEFALNSPRVGIDIINNRILHTGSTDTRPIHLCTRAYVSACLAHLLTGPLDQLASRTIGLNEFSPTGNDIVSAFEKRFGAAPRIARETEERSLRMMQEGHPWALAESVKLKWSRGEHSVGDDRFDLPGYRKKGLQELVGDRQLEKYRQLPFDYATALDEHFK